MFLTIMTEGHRLLKEAASFASVSLLCDLNIETLSVYKLYVDMNKGDVLKD